MNSIQSTLSRLEVMGSIKNGGMRETRARGEVVPALEAMKIVSGPLSNYLAAAAWSVKMFYRN